MASESLNTHTHCDRRKCVHQKVEFTAARHFTFTLASMPIGDHILVVSATEPVRVQSTVKSSP